MDENINKSELPEIDWNALEKLGIRERKNQSVHLLIKPSIHEKLKEEAKKENISVNELINRKLQKKEEEEEMSKNKQLSVFDGQKRNDALHITVTTEEKEMIRKRANEKGMPCNEYLINLCKINEELKEENESLKVKAEKQNNFDVNFHNFYNDVVKTDLTLEESLIKRYEESTGESVTHYKDILNWLRRQAEKMQPKKKQLFSKEEKNWLKSVADLLGKTIYSISKYAENDATVIGICFTDDTRSLLPKPATMFNNIEAKEHKIQKGTLDE